MRHRDAWSSARAQPTPAEEGFSSLSRRKYCLLTTFRRSGDPVPTPVWFGLAGGNLYFHSESSVGKIKKPVFVVQGKNDPRVPVSESEQMVKAIRDQGGTAWYLMAKDEGHGFAKKRNFVGKKHSKSQIF